MSRVNVVDVEPMLKRCEAATEGPWADMDNGTADCSFPGEIRGCVGFDHICSDPECDDRPNDRAFIANARTDLPDTIADLLATRRERDELQAGIDRLKVELAEMRDETANEAERSAAARIMERAVYCEGGSNMCAVLIQHDIFGGVE